MEIDDEQRRCRQLTGFAVSAVIKWVKIQNVILIPIAGSSPDSE